MESRQRRPSRTQSGGASYCTSAGTLTRFLWGLYPARTVRGKSEEASASILRNPSLVWRNASAQFNPPSAQVTEQCGVPSSSAARATFRRSRNKRMISAWMSTPVACLGGQRLLHAVGTPHVPRRPEGRRWQIARGAELAPHGQFTLTNDRGVQNVSSQVLQHAIVAPSCRLHRRSPANRRWIRKASEGLYRTGSGRVAWARRESPEVGVQRAHSIRASGAHHKVGGRGNGADRQAPVSPRRRADITGRYRSAPPVRPPPLRKDRNSHDSGRYGRRQNLSGGAGGRIPVHIHGCGRPKW